MPEQGGGSLDQRARRQHQAARTAIYCGSMVDRRSTTCRFRTRGRRTEAAVAQRGWPRRAELRPSPAASAPTAQGPQFTTHASVRLRLRECIVVMSCIRSPAFPRRVRAEFYTCAKLATHRRHAWSAQQELGDAPPRYMMRQVIAAVR